MLSVRPRLLASVSIIGLITRLPPRQKIMLTENAWPRCEIVWSARVK